MEINGRSGMIVQDSCCSLVRGGAPVSEPSNSDPMAGFALVPVLCSRMIHENLSQAIEDLSSRIIAIRDSL